MRSRCTRVSLILLGGEPLLDFGLFREAVEYAKRVKPRGKRIRFDTSTNGTLLDRERVAFLARHRIHTQISFDGVREAQDVRGRGTFDVLDRLLTSLGRDQPAFLRDRVRIAVTFTMATARHLAASMRYFIHRGVRNVVISPVSTPDPSWTTGSIDDLDRHLGRLYDVCLRHYRRTDEVPLHLFRKRHGRTPRRPERIGMCGVGMGRTFAIDVDGEVVGCALLARSYQSLSPFLRARLDPMRLGDFRSAGFAARRAHYPGAARAAEIFDNKEKKYSSFGRCGDCRHLGDCVVCPVSIGAIPGNDDPRRVPDLACAWNLVSLKYRARFPAQPDATDLLTGRGHVPDMMRELLAATQAMREPPKGRRP
jgi:sulfatase maturation enzyme AslB (radical SAM superfamily)